jgi:kelch-like protein 17 (actinfilin)
VDPVVRIDPARRTAGVTAHLDEPLSDLGAAVAGGRTYLVGGYTGTRFASAVLRYVGRGRTVTVARLPTGLRYAGVAALHGTIYVAGGLSTTGETAAVRAVDPVSGSVQRVATLPARNAYGALVAFHGALFLIGGKTAAGTAVATVLRIDPAAHRVTVAGRLPHGLAEPAAVSRADDVLVVGGEGSRAVLSLKPSGPR